MSRQFSFDKAIQFMKDLVAIDTTPENATTPALEYVEAELQSQNIVYWKEPLDDGRHGVLLARIGPDVSGGCLLSGHLDVVSVKDEKWNSNPFEAIESNGKLFGRGTCDMKGFIACALAAIPKWKTDNLLRPIYIGLTTDEESRVSTINDLLHLVGKKARPALAILGEPTSMNIVDAHKGVQEFFVDIEGVSCHSSRPDLGINANSIGRKVMNFVEDVIAVDLQNDFNDVAFLPPYASVNVGQICGGTAVNVVAGKCSVNWDMRQLKNAQAVTVKSRFAEFVQESLKISYPEARVNVSYMYMPALERREENAAVDVARILLGNKELQTVAFGTEGGFIQNCGMDTIVCGPGDIKKAHAANEYVPLNEIRACVDFLQGLSSPQAQKRIAMATPFSGPR